MSRSLRAALVAACAALVLPVLASAPSTGALATPAPLAVPTSVAILPPPTAGVLDYQLGGTYPPAADVDVVTRDRTQSPVEGRYSICYVNSFQTQPGRLSWWKKNHPELLLRDRKGRLVRDPGWPEEVLLDIRTSSRRTTLARINRSWFVGCGRAGYQAVEPDNLDSWTRSGGLIKQAHAVSLATTLVREAHRAGVAIGQKNAPELSRKGIGFDFAVAEECEVYRECGEYTDVYGTRLVEIEYSDNGGRRAFERACAARSGEASILLRDRDVVPKGSKGYVSTSC